jgi:peptide/nickel transport system substrate-binding protein
MARRPVNHAADRPARRRTPRGVVLALIVAVTLGTLWSGAFSSAGAQSSGGGVLRVPYDLTAFGGARWDPTTPTNPDIWYAQRWIYDSLMRQNANGSYSPGLAKSADATDPQTIAIELKPNIKFSDGTPLDAEAVKFSIERTIAAKNVGSVRAELNEVESITVDSPTKLTIKLKTPIAGQFYSLLAHGETYVVSPTAVNSGTPLDEKPVGAGPFVLDSYTPEGKAVFKKNPNYFEKDKIKLKGIELIQTTQAGIDPQAPINSLLDGITNAAQMAGLTGTEALESGGIKVDVIPSETTAIYTALCKSKPPFDDLKVRQAINYAIDRDQINQLLYQGTSEPMWADWTTKSAYFNPKLDGYYAHNVKKAKKLLKQAGAENLTYDMYANLTPDTTRVAEIIKEQMAEAGITVNLVNTTNIVQDFFTDAKAPSSLIPLRRGGLDKVTRNLAPGSIGDTCGYDDPKLNAYIAKLKELGAGSKEYEKTWQQMDEYIVKNALHQFIIWSPAVNAYNPDEVTKVAYAPDVLGQLRFDAFKTQVKG